MEVLIATGIMTTALVSLAQLFAVSTRANHQSRNDTLSTVLAEQKMEQLRGLTWTLDANGIPVSDTSTDVSVSPESPTGGKGLNPSPAGVLGKNTPGYVDYLDQHGNWMGNGASPPNGTVYIRRWSLAASPDDPANVIILQVLVTHRRDRGTADQGAVARLPHESRLVSVKVRRTT